MAKIHRVKVAQKLAGRCDKCLNWINKGDPYKWIAIKLRGDNPSTRKVRCEGCDDWHEWEWNPSIPAQAKRIAHDTEETLRYHRIYETEAEAEAIMREAAHDIGILANTRQVSADRARYVFGNVNFRTKQFDDDAHVLRVWALQVGKWKCPPLPEPELQDCSFCSAKRMDLDAGGDANCAECQGAGRYVGEEPSQEQMDDWRLEVADDASEVLELCPI